MSQYYRGKRTRGMFDPKATAPFAISRSKIDLLLECPFCFYVDRRLGVGRPQGFPFTLNSAVDTLLKKEFDILRKDGTPHSLFKEFNVDAVPFQHEKMDIWRDTFKGVRYLHRETNLEIFGAVDDIWINPAGEVHVVDYKATSKTSEVNLDAEWQIGYKRQMEIYQWLLRKNDLTVSNTGYFVYANGDSNAPQFDAKLEFEIKIIPYVGNDDWIEKTLLTMKKVLMDPRIPKSSPDCDWCTFREGVEKERSMLNKKTLFDN